MKKFNLNNHKKEVPFKVPDGYFEQLNKRINDKIDTSPKSFHLGVEEAPFKVPEKYFDQLNEKILDKIDNDKSHSVVSNTRNKLWYSIAAAVLVLVISVPMLLFENTSTTDANILADISNDEILLYLDYYEINEIDLMESIDENMEWVNDEGELLEEMDFQNTNMDELYLEYDLSEIM